MRTSAQIKLEAIIFEYPNPYIEVNIICLAPKKKTEK